MLKITANVLSARGINWKFTDSEKEVLAYALTTFLNSKGLVVNDLKIQEVKDGLASAGK